MPPSARPAAHARQADARQRPGRRAPPRGRSRQTASRVEREVMPRACASRRAPARSVGRAGDDPRRPAGGRGPPGRRGGPEEPARRKMRSARDRRTRWSTSGDQRRCRQRPWDAGAGTGGGRSGGSRRGAAQRRGSEGHRSPQPAAIGKRSPRSGGTGGRRRSAPLQPLNAVAGDEALLLGECAQRQH
jgi:hypothetical protein